MPRRRKAYPASVRERAARLSQRGLNHYEIAEKIGVSQPTVNRWLRPEFEERERVKARERKFKDGGICVDCGRPTSRGPKGPSRRCRPCERAMRTENRYWNRTRMIAAIQLWNEQYGKPPAVREWSTASKGPVEHPAHTTIWNGPSPVFKTWNEAIEAAGFTPRKIGKQRKEKK